MGRLRSPPRLQGQRPQPSRHHRRGCFSHLSCCLNHITVCGFPEAADQRGTDERTSAMKPGQRAEPRNEPNSWKGGGGGGDVARVRWRRRSQPWWPACLDPDNSRSIRMSPPPPKVLAWRPVSQRGSPPGAGQQGSPQKMITHTPADAQGLCFFTVTDI